MGKTKVGVMLTSLAKTIGWELVNEDKGFSTYEFEIEESKHEHISHIIRILEDPNELEVYEILLTLIKVMPAKVRAKVNKLINKLRIEQTPDMIELVEFTVNEYKKNTEFSKLSEYGALLGVDILALGYRFQYKLKKHKRAEILSVIELNLTSNLAPILGKIKKTEYKIAYIKANDKKLKDND